MTTDCLDTLTRYIFLVCCHSGLIILFQLKLFSGLGLASSSLSGYVATVQLPHKTPLHTPVVGKVKLRKEWAKRSAALRVVENLHKLGELDDSLKVKKKDVVVIDDDYEDESNDEGGALGNRKFYRHKLSPLFAANIDFCLYLHIIEFKLVEALPNARYRLHYPQDDPHCLGLLTTSRLPVIVQGRKSGWLWKI